MSVIRLGARSGPEGPVEGVGKGRGTEGTTRLVLTLESTGVRDKFRSDTGSRWS